MDKGGTAPNQPSRSHHDRGGLLSFRLLNPVYDERPVLQLRLEPPHISGSACGGAGDSTRKGAFGEPRALLSSAGSRAAAALERALAIQTAAHGGDHPSVAIALSNLAAIQRRQSDLTGARVKLERANAILSAAPRPDARGDLRNPPRARGLYFGWQPGAVGERGACAK
jgi:hypothetical protein